MLPDLERVAALAFTSANGVRAFAAASPERGLPVFAVGAATAQRAREAGFGAVASADGDVAALARMIAGQAAGLAGAVLHPGAMEGAGDLVGTLGRLGVEARALALYETVPAKLSAADLAALPGLDVVLLHSPKAARAVAAILGASPAPQLRALGMSQAVIEALAGTQLAAKVSAPFPLEAAMLNLIDLGP